VPVVVDRERRAPREDRAARILASGWWATDRLDEPFGWGVLELAQPCRARIAASRPRTSRRRARPDEETVLTDTALYQAAGECTERARGSCVATA